jgi:hypothetical protein
MSMLGVVAPVNSDSKENYTHLLSLSQDLLLNLLRNSFPTNKPIKIQLVMEEFQESHLPVHVDKSRDTLATYFEIALDQAESNDSIELRQASDFGRVFEIDGSGYNSLTLRVSDHQ